MADPGRTLGPLQQHLDEMAREARQRKDTLQANTGHAASAGGGGGGEASSSGRGIISPASELRVANLMGSHGSKAVAMALAFGITPTVVDISEGGFIPGGRSAALQYCTGLHCRSNS